MLIIVLALLGAAIFIATWAFQLAVYAAAAAITLALGMILSLLIAAFGLVGCAWWMWSPTFRRDVTKERERMDAAEKRRR